MMNIEELSCLILLTSALLLQGIQALQSPLGRREALIAPAVAATAALALPEASLARGDNGLVLNTAATSGLKWADAKVGTGQPLTSGAVVSIDYTMASTVGRQPQIYTTKDKGAPYRFRLGDGSTIAGIELAIMGDEQQGIPPMLPGGIRRVIIPSSLGYEVLRKPNAKCEAGKVGSIGPIPPKAEDSAAYNRWYQVYCNPRIPYQPDIVLDVKLYGKR